MRKLQLLIIAITLAAAVLGLGGCRRTDTNNQQASAAAGRG